MKIGAIVQARMNSERFPGKVLHRVQGKPLLQYLLEGLSQCGSLEKVVVATSVEHSDGPVVQFCRNFGVDYYRGPLEDVAKRFLEAAEANGLDVFVRINGDSPLLDYRLVDQAVEIFRSGNYDLVTNVLQRTYPRGQSVEVVRVETLKNVYPFLQSDAEREHVTPYIYAHKDQFSVSSFESGGDYGSIHLAVDTPEEMHRFESMVASMERHHWEYTYEELISSFKQLPTA
ncbi:MAG: cytidylyltransferase domain-containing protein [Candidatus Thorarchaeota archaeon]|jgi:spore coat polysaccharide biosynthesis protein SpsF